MKQRNILLIKKIFVLYVFNLNILMYGEINNIKNANLYLELMKNILTNFIYQDDASRNFEQNPIFLPFDAYLRDNGKDWPQNAHTMVGRKRLENVRYCIEQVLQNNIPGDLLEAGVWRGGTSIFMKAVLEAFNDKNRKVWVCDSFEGLPAPSLAQDVDINLHVIRYLSVTLEEVKNNFLKYNLLDDKVEFVKGWFKDTLPNLSVEKISVLRLDGDMYESTKNILESLYHKVSKNGFIIIDDWIITNCRNAVLDFREKHNIQDNIIAIDDYSAFWQKTN